MSVLDMALGNTFLAEHKEEYERAEWKSKSDSKIVVGDIIRKRSNCDYGVLLTPEPAIALAHSGDKRYQDPQEWRVIVLFVRFENDGRLNGYKSKTVLLSDLHDTIVEGCSAKFE